MSSLGLTGSRSLGQSGSTDNTQPDTKFKLQLGTVVTQGFLSPTHLLGHSFLCPLLLFYGLESQE